MRRHLYVPAGASLYYYYYYDKSLARFPAAMFSPRVWHPATLLFLPKRQSWPRCALCWVVPPLVLTGSVRIA